MTWQQHAACGGADPERFAPIDRFDPTLIPALRETAALCASCPALEACAGFADRNRYSGIWGGTYRYGPTNKYLWHRLFDGAPEPVLTDRRSGVRTGQVA